MTSSRVRFVDQLRRNAVALISLVIAITSLGYNSWRNEQSESNRNQREAGFELLMRTAELRELVYLQRYDRDSVDESAARSAWVVVLAIQDLARLLDEPIPDSAATLLDAWSSHEDTIAQRASADAVEASLDALRDDTVAMIDALD